MTIFERKPGAKPLPRPEKLSKQHETILVVALTLGESGNIYRAADVRSFMGARGRAQKASSISQALRYLANRNYISQIGPGTFVKFVEPANDVPLPSPHRPKTFRGLTHEDMMAGKARVRRPKQVNLEEAISPEDAPK